MYGYQFRPFSAAPAYYGGPSPFGGQPFNGGRIGGGFSSYSRPLTSASVTTPSYGGNYTARSNSNKQVSDVQGQLAITATRSHSRDKVHTKTVYGGVTEPRTHIGITSTRSETTSPIKRQTEPITSRPQRVVEPQTARPALGRATSPSRITRSPRRPGNPSATASPRGEVTQPAITMGATSQGQIRVAVSPSANEARRPPVSPAGKSKRGSTPNRGPGNSGKGKRGNTPTSTRRTQSARKRVDSHNSAEDIESSSSSSLPFKPAEDYEDLTQAPMSPLHRTSAGTATVSRKQSVEEMVQTLNRNSPKRSPKITPKKQGGKGKGTGSNKGRGGTRLFDKEERPVGVDDFEVIKVLGKGGFAKVFLVRKKDTGMVYAMKVIKKSTAMRERKGVEYCETEQNVLSRVNHPFIVGLKWSFQTRQKLYLVLDYGAGGELYFHLRRRRKFSEDVVRFYAAEIVLAFECLHDIGVIYRDLKPENICFGADGHLILTDFGLSKQDIYPSRRAHSFCGTAEYMAPEMISQTGHGPPVDWWSLGVIIYELLTGRPPYSSPVQSSNEVMHKIMVGDLYLPAEASEQARSIIRGLLQRDVHRRLGTKNDAEEVKSHPFFKGIRWSDLLAKRVKPPVIPEIASETDTSNFDPHVVGSDIHDADDYDDPALNERPYMFKGFEIDVTHQSPDRDRRARTTPHRRPQPINEYRAKAPAGSSGAGATQGGASNSRGVGGGVYAGVPYSAMRPYGAGFGGLPTMSASRPHMGGGFGMGMRFY